MIISSVKKIIVLPFVRALSDIFFIPDVLDLRCIFMFLSIQMLLFHNVYFESSAVISVPMFAFIDSQGRRLKQIC